MMMENQTYSIPIPNILDKNQSPYGRNYRFEIIKNIKLSSLSSSYNQACFMTLQHRSLAICHPHLRRAPQSAPQTDEVTATYLNT